MVLTTYATRTYGSGLPRKYWRCHRWPACRGTHGAHPDGTPAGIPADQETRRARQRAHAALDPLWKLPGLEGAALQRERGAIYKWLSLRLAMTIEECHIARMDLATCERVVQICAERGARETPRRTA